MLFSIAVALMTFQTNSFKKIETSSILAAPVFAPLPITDIEPTGWLRKQLRIQADGLSGHLDEFWPDVAQSGWIGGAAEGWERGPYWLDGMVPLAYLLDDAVLQAKVRRWMDYILTHQAEDGWLGPVQAKDRRAYDAWPVFIIFKAMTQYAEVSGDERVVEAMLRCCRKLDALLDTQPLSDWGKARWGDLLLSLYWLYERRPEAWLLELAEKVKKQGLDWRAHFADFSYRDKLPPDAKFDFPTHGVNNAMALKTYAVWSRQSHNPADRDAVHAFIDTLDKYHGQATGIFTCDEHYAGLNPSQGTELCAVVEYMFSMETLLSILGEPAFGDRLERIAFNNLPATFTSDMWAHQFDQQANQVVCRNAGPVVYTYNGPDANIFGLEPCYGCCTANMHQGWPKFAAHLWMRHGDDGLAAVAYAPSTVKTTIKDVSVQIDLETNYPFDDTLTFTVKTAQPVTFTLYLRIPGWAQKPTLMIENEKAVNVAAGVFYRLTRLWKNTTKLKLQLPMTVTTQQRYHNSVAITRGPLVYALKIAENWKKIKEQPQKSGDWEVYPESPWNYALAIDPQDPAKSIAFRIGDVGDCPFSPQGAPITAVVKGRQLSQWTIESNAAGPLPFCPVDSREPLEELTLIPYGCTHLRITEFPWLTNNSE